MMTPSLNNTLKITQNQVVIQKTIWFFVNFYLHLQYSDCIINVRSNRAMRLFFSKHNRWRTAAQVRESLPDAKFRQQKSPSFGQIPSGIHSFPDLPFCNKSGFSYLGEWKWNLRSGWTGKRIGLFSFYSSCLFRHFGGGVFGVPEFFWSGGWDRKDYSLFRPFFYVRNLLHFIRIRMNGRDELDFIWSSSLPFFLFC